MKQIFCSRKVFFSLLMLSICLSVILCVALYFNSSQNRSNCGEIVLSKVPVYPNSLKLDDNSLNFISPVGDIKYIYRTTDAFEKVKSFYENYSTCSETFFREYDGDAICTGGVPGDFYSYYEVEIKQQSGMTRYTLYIQWNCGVLDD